MWFLFITLQFFGESSNYYWMIGDKFSDSFNKKLSLAFYYLETVLFILILLLLLVVLLLIVVMPLKPNLD